MKKTIHFSRLKYKENNLNIHITYSNINLISIDITNNKNKNIAGCIYDIKNKEFIRIKEYSYFAYLKKSMPIFITKSKNTYIKENGL